MKRTTAVLAFTIGFLFGASAQDKIAIFDYDDRLAQPDTLAKYIEVLIKTQNPGFTVDQFSGKAKEDTAIQTISRIDAGGYKMIILITSDAILLAQHFLKKTPALFANANNPLGLGFTSYKAPGGNMSGASYYVPIENKLKFFKEVMPGKVRARWTCVSAANLIYI